MVSIILKETGNKKLRFNYENEIILDIGPKTIQNISMKIDASKTVLWNGPAGYFENKEFFRYFSYS